MHDSKGRPLKVGDQLLIHQHGVLTVNHIYEESDYMVAGKADKSYSFAHTQHTFLLQFPDAIKLRSWKELAEEAVLTWGRPDQALVLYELVNSFASIIREVKDRLELEGKVGKEHLLQRHPIIQVYTDRICSLTGTHRDDPRSSIESAYDWCMVAKKG